MEGDKTTCNSMLHPEAMKLSEKKIFDGNHAVLEFETTMDGLSVNGVDIISCDDDGKIVEFKVMLRPQKAVEKAREQMMAALEQLNL